MVWVPPGAQTTTGGFQYHKLGAELGYRPDCCKKYLVGHIRPGPAAPDGIRRDPGPREGSGAFGEEDRPTIGSRP
jgi:hypothetical protein